MCITWEKQRPFLLWMALYVAVVAITAFIVSPSLPLAVKVALALAPMVPATFALFAIVRMFRGLDELQRQIVAESILSSFCVTAILTVTYGFLQSYAGAPHLIWVWVWPVMALSWIIATVIIKPRYR